MSVVVKLKKQTKNAVILLYRGVRVANCWKEHLGEF